MSNSFRGVSTNDFTSLNAKPFRGAKANENRIGVNSSVYGTYPPQKRLYKLKYIDAKCTKNLMQCWYFWNRINQSIDFFLLLHFSIIEDRVSFIAYVVRITFFCFSDDLAAFHTDIDLSSNFTWHLDSSSYNFFVCLVSFFYFAVVLPAFNLYYNSKLVVNWHVVNRFVWSAK